VVDLVACVASFAKKILKDRRAFILQNTCCDIASVIEARQLQKVDYASGSTAHGIRAAENDAADSRVHERACARRARPPQHIKVAIEYSLPDLCRAGFSQRAQPLTVTSRVTRRLYHVPSPDEPDRESHRR
jgi:hypothetical protein